MTDDRDDVPLTDTPDMTRRETLQQLGQALGEPVTFVQPPPSPAQRRARLRLIAAALLGAVPLGLPVVGAGFEFVGLDAAAEAVRQAPAMVRALVRPPAGFSRWEATKAIDSGEPTLFVTIPTPTDEWLRGRAVNVSHGDVRVAAYLFIDPREAEARGCHAFGYYGSKPFAGYAATIGLHDDWTLRWQSEHSDERICDDAATEIVVYLVPATYSLPRLSDAHTIALPEELSEHAIDVARIVLRRPGSERPQPYVITTYEFEHPRAGPR